MLIDSQIGRKILRQLLHAREPDRPSRCACSPSEADAIAWLKGQLP
jgi:hypothetical protein